MKTWPGGVENAGDITGMVLIERSHVMDNEREWCLIRALVRKAGQKDEDEIEKGTDACHTDVDERSYMVDRPHVSG